MSYYHGDSIAQQLFSLMLHSPTSHSLSWLQMNQNWNYQLNSTAMIDLMMSCACSGSSRACLITGAWLQAVKAVVSCAIHLWQAVPCPQEPHFFLELS